MADKYDKLREALREYNFPMVYPFKFIIKADQNKLIDIKRVFDETAEFEVKESKKGTYTSITIKQMMLNTDDIIVRYIQMEKIEGVISL
jgi:putative lipoic acid-binding regulatory protein